MEEFCRSESPPPFLPSSRPRVCANARGAVTQIPLETAPRQQDGSTPPSNRPPWVRPVRKKASSNARSPAGSGDSPLNHGSPEDFQPTDAFLDHLHTTPQPQQQPPPQPQPQPPQPQAFAAQAQGPFGMSSPAAFMDPGNMMQTDPMGPGGMSAADLMAFLNADAGQLDMSAILASPALGSLDQQPNGFYHLGTPTPSAGGALSP